MCGEPDLRQCRAMERSGIALAMVTVQTAQAAPRATSTSVQGHNVSS